MASRSSTPVPVTVHPDGMAPIKGHDVLRMWVENEPDRLLFRSVDSGDVFTHNKMPNGGTVQAQSPGKGGIGVLSKRNRELVMRG